jgi:S1-C subfamily serine protease
MTKIQKIKLFLNYYVQHLLNIGVFALKTLMLTASMLVFSVFVLVLVTKAPEFHSLLIREKVGSRVFLLASESGGSGTGFALKAKSGLTYIVTNDHVCASSHDGYNILVKNNKGAYIPRRIIAKSQKSDLCLVESLPNVEGLELGSRPSVGQIIGAVGHPKGYDKTLSRGEIIMQRDVSILKGPMYMISPLGEFSPIPKEQGGVSEKECRAVKNKKIKLSQQVFIFKIEMIFCEEKVNKAYFTNMIVQPGSSGSPLINFWGNVIGVVFSVDQANWSQAVSYEDLEDFISQY